MFATLSFRDTTINLTLHEGADVCGLVSYLRSHFRWHPGGRASPTAVCHLHVYPPTATLERWSEAVAWSPPLTQARSLRSPLRAARSDHELLWYPRTGTRVVVHPESRRVDLAYDPVAPADLIDIVSILVLRDQENRGAIIMGVSAAERAGALAIIAGEPGSGCTTTLLELVERHGFHIVSGERVLFRAGSGLRLELDGWPSRPRVGLQTAARYPGLAALVGDPRSRAGRAATLVDPLRFRELFSHAAAEYHGAPTEVLLPRLGSGSRTTVRIVEGGRLAREGHFHPRMESAFADPRSPWNELVPDLLFSRAELRRRVVRGLSELPIRAVRGSLQLGAAAFVPVIV